MKNYFPLAFKLSIVLLSALLVIFAIYNNINNPLLCEHCENYLSDDHQDTVFWKIEKRSGVSVWDVLFKNVNVRYEVSSSDRAHLDDHENQDFRMKQIGTEQYNSHSVDQVRVNRSVVDAVRDHFNEIQRGNIHNQSPNYLNENAHGRGANSNLGINSPLDQFAIKQLVLIVFNYKNAKFSFTSMALYLMVSAYIASIITILYNKLTGLISNFWSFIKESIYATIHGIVLSQINVIKGQKFLPFIYTLFIFIIVNNVVGMIPYSFSSTSHFILTFFISFTIVSGSTVLGVFNYLSKFLSILVPQGCPVFLLPLLVLIESISYLARNVSLGLRLAANVLSGHMLLNILSNFTYKFFHSGFKLFCIAFIPLVFISGFSTLETGICFIQAQVFSVLSSSYIRDGIILH